MPARVDAYLAAHPDMRERLDLAYREQNETAFLNRSEDIGPATTAKQFMAVLAENRPDPKPERVSWFKRLFDMPASGAMRWAAAAAVLVIVVQSAAIVMLAGLAHRGHLSGGDRRCRDHCSGELRADPLRRWGNAPAADI